MTPLDLADTQRRIDTQRPLHWAVAAQLVREVEALRTENERLRAALAVAHQAPASSDGSTLQPGPKLSCDAAPDRAPFVTRDH